MPTSDPLLPFPRWEGHPNELGDNADTNPGITATRELQRDSLHVAGAHGTAIAMPTMNGQLPELIPGVRVRLLAGAYASGPRYHVLDTFLDHEVALELADVLRLAAWRARIDIAVHTGAMDEAQAEELRAQLTNLVDTDEEPTDTPEPEEAPE